MDESVHRDPFQILGLAPRYRIDAQELRLAWMRKAAQVHPDAAGTDLEGTYANDAFRILSDPIARAHALLRHLSAPTGDQRAMPEGFLLEMMELREQADAAQGDSRAIGLLRAEATRRRGEAIERVARCFDPVEEGLRGQAPVSSESVQTVLMELNVIRAFDRMLEQLEREAGDG